MVQLIEKAILEYTNDPAQHKPTVAPKVVKALTDAELKAQVCADFREGPVTGYTCAKANCKRQHIKGVSNCTHPLYLKYGRCPDYYTTCKLLHPFPDSAKAAYGSPGAGWAAFQQDRAKAKKAGRALCPVFECDQDRSEVGSAINIVAGPRSNRGRIRPQHGFELVAEAIDGDHKVQQGRLHRSLRQIVRVPHGSDDIEPEVAAELNHRLAQLDAIHTPLPEYLLQKQRL